MRFGSTRWSLIQRASGDGEDSRTALEELCQSYWPAVFAFVRGKGYSHADTEDFTQGFFAFVIEKEVLASADASRGRFRNFLKAAVRNYMANEWDKKTAQKRGGTAVHIRLDDAEWLSATAGGADIGFDRAWGLTLLTRTLDRLGEEYRARDRAEVFEALKPILTGEGVDKTYRQIGKDLALSETAVKLTVHRMRGRFKELLEAEILDTVDTPEDAERELSDLREIFSQR